MRGSHGLSARRARRTKSRMPEGQKAGPKGRQLEVGAQRAPRLLVSHNCLTICSDGQKTVRRVRQKNLTNGGVRNNLLYVQICSYGQKTVMFRWSEDGETGEAKKPD